MKFNSSLLAGGKVEVKDYNKSNTKAFRVSLRERDLTAKLPCSWDLLSDCLCIHSLAQSVITVADSVLA